jgi:flagellar hook assembly protein FlgD
MADDMGAYIPGDEFTFSQGDFSVTINNVSSPDEEISFELTLLPAVGMASPVPAPENLLRLANTPNPFHHTTRVRFTVPPGPVEKATLCIYDLHGQVIKTLLAGDVNPGTYSMVWDGHTDFCRRVPAGMYVYQLAVGNLVQEARLMVLE